MQVSWNVLKNNIAGDWSQAVARFVLDFEKEFEKAPIEDRKGLIKKCISRIVVDREEGVARFYVRRIPAVTPELLRLLEPPEDHRKVVTCVSARRGILRLRFDCPVDHVGDRRDRSASLRTS